MDKHIPAREEAFQLLTAYTRSPALINHALAVEAVMRYMARKQSDNEDMWGIVGLVHDIDYEQFPDDHCIKASEILLNHGWPDEWIRAVVSHGWGICNDIEPLTILEKTLFAVDELTGLITACALVRPSKSISDLTVKSVRKKWKQPSFAAGANREIIDQGAEMLGIDRDILIADAIAGMQEVADTIGL